MVSRTNKFIQGQGKVREFKFELGKICWRHLYLEEIFFFLGTKFLLTPLFTSEIHPFFERMYFLPSLKEVWEK